ncbi:hypothetical protein BBW65_06885 [Helicobacter enhydrae]|uniref:Beta-lactamase n=1 Tax=Helicobacter enhydrae TaxID=222136 RepID=A0A1B1U773_9HELI|nr:hypothetical protein [Helicobacter enhydrae]ANV98535.1 hypothetical protein BBW65_06885 [Helicobacter enhydrae]
MRTFLFSLIILILLTSCRQDPFAKALTLYQDNKIQSSLPYFQESCKNGTLKACKILSTLLLQNHQSPLQPLQYACKLGDVPSCQMGAKLSYTQDKQQFLAFVDSGCKWGNPQLCFTQSWYLYNAHDIDASLKYAIKACYGGIIKACILGASIYRDQKLDDEAQKLEAQRKKLRSLPTA